MDTHRTTHPERLSPGLASPDPAGELTRVDISVCIVTYKARDLLGDCLRSLAENTRLSYEVIVVDNGSGDGLGEMLARDFPAVRFIQNDANLGYTAPENQALRLGRGRFLMQLNPDTLILPAALDRLAAFLDEHPQAGICGPKVLNRDLTLQKTCRRGESRPWAVISYFSGLSRLFPNSKRFSEYLLTYMDEDTAHLAAGVAGSCMLIRREVVDQIGYLDEQFFAYQEDADYCFRARQAGWQVWYVPEARIVHFGGMGGSRVEPYRTILAWHQSYFRYYRKNLARDYFFLFNGFFYLLMGLKFISAILAAWARRGSYAGSPERARRDQPGGTVSNPP
jgi:GT2 family glycosyltransferase